jgi:putative endonuclease
VAEERTYFVYILASRPYGTLYIGVTNDLYRRMIEHRERRVPGFTKKYRVTKLMYFEMFAYIEDAIQREKSLKEWPRVWKTNLIERSNPHWQDLFPAMQRFGSPQTSGACGTMDPGHKARDDTGE